MILLNFFIGFLALFIAPQIFIHCKYANIKHSILLMYGLIASFTLSWIFFLIIFYLKLANVFIYLISIFMVIASFTYMCANKTTKGVNRPALGYLIWLITIIAMMPLLLHIGDGFRGWDAIASWNRWAIELFNNEYQPINAAYPILLPAVWSLIYKMQGTSEIWWTAQVTIFVIPVLTLAILLTLYTENKNKAFIFMAILLYPYLIWTNVVNGYMDMPVMMLGTLSLIILYAAEINKDKKEFTLYIYGALLIAALATITKQAGFAFLLFSFIYILLNLNLFKNKKKLMQISIVSLLYFVTYLTIFYQYKHRIAGNFDYLHKLSSQRNFLGQDMPQSLKYISGLFFSYPPYISWLSSVIKPLKITPIPITPYLIGLGLILFVFKDLRKYNSVGFLSGIFFVLGLCTWIRYFSYDPRNSYWVKSFFIIFLSINCGYISNKYAKKHLPTRLVYLIVVLAVGIYLYKLGNDFAYEKQAAFQSKIGNPHIAKTIVKLLKGKNVCTKLYTNNTPLQYNYYLRKIQKQIIIGRWYVPGFLPHLKHTCKDGRYFLFGAWTVTRKNTGWKKIKGLVKSGKIVPVGHKTDLIYFVPPSRQRR